MSRYLIPVSTCLLIATTTSAWAEIEPVQVTASRLPEPPPVTLTVLDEQRIENQHGRDILDLLRVTPGISTTQPGGPGGFSEVFLRSAESNFTVVLIDGVRVNDPSNPRGGGYDFSTLNVDEIERLEIARGALSAVHGSDAMAGVINIITKRPSAERSASVRAEAGADDFQRASAILSGPIAGDVRGSLKASYVDFGDAVAGSTQRVASAQADIELGSSEAGIGQIRGGVRYAERDRESYPDASGGPLFAALPDKERSHAEESSAWAHTTRSFSPAWSMDASVSFFTRREDTITPPVAPGVFEGVPASTSDSRFTRGQVTVSQRYSTSERFEIGGGVDLQLEEGKRDGELDLGFAMLPSEFDLERVVRAAYTEARYRVHSLELYGAVRVDDSDDDDARGSGRLAASYAFEGSGTRFHASWSNGHKQPSFYALGDTLVGNPDLRVETSETIELGLEQRWAAERLIGALTAFKTRYEDLIDFDFTTFRLVNRSRASIDGVEGSLTAHLTQNLTARAHATLSDIELDSGDAVLLYRPETYGGLQLAMQVGQSWSIQAHAQYVGEREGSSVPTGPVRLDAYERVDFAVSRDLNDHARVFVSLDNAFDEDYQEAVGFPDAGRQVRFGASVSF